MRLILMIVYLVIGVVVAAARNYLGDVGGVGDIVNLLLAVLLWPLVLAGVEFNLDIGGGRDGRGDNQNGALLLLGPQLAYARSALRSTRKLDCWYARCFAQPVKSRNQTPEHSRF